MKGHHVRHIVPKIGLAGSPLADSGQLGCLSSPSPHRGGRAKIWTGRNIAVLCDVIADGGNFTDAARACKVSAMQAEGRFNSIVRSYGRQGR